MRVEQDPTLLSDLIKTEFPGQEGQKDEGIDQDVVIWRRGGVFAVGLGKLLYMGSSAQDGENEQYLSLFLNF